MSTITRPVGGKIPNPNPNEVILVQKLLNKHRPPPLRIIAEDGIEGPETTGAIEEFQRRVLKMRGQTVVWTPAARRCVHFRPG